MKSFLKEQYKKYADKYYGSWIYWNSSVVAINLKNELDGLFQEYISTESEVLDLGAGRLPYKKIIEQYTKKYFSMDFQKTHPDLDYIGTASDTKMKDERFDIVFCNQVLEHVPDPDESFEEIRRILKPGGIGIISTPFLVELHNEPYDFFRYTKYALKMFAEKSGFEVLSLSETGGIFAILGRYVSRFMILAFYWIPVLKYLAMGINVIFQRIFMFLDKYLGMKSVFPSEYILVIRKKNGK